MSAVKLLKPVHSEMNELNKVWSEVCLGFFFCTERSYGFAPTYQLSYVWKAEEFDLPLGYDECRLFDECRKPRYSFLS